MLWDVSDLLRFADVYAPEALVTPAARRTLQTLPGFLPKCAVLGVLETRLAADDAQVDFQACLWARHGSQEALEAGLGRVEQWAAADDRGDGARRTAAVLRAWTTPGSLFHRVPVVWLEFDLESGAGAPFPFVGLCSEERTVGSARSSLEERDALRAIMATLLGRELPEGLGRVLDECRAALPDGAYLRHGAAMSNRGREAIRLVVCMRRHDLPAYLGRIGWRGAPGLAELIDRLGADPPTLNLQLELADGVQAPIGIEYCYPTSPREDPRWRRLLAALAERGACSAEKRAAVTGWPPHASDRADARFWPVRVRRFLSVKVTLRPPGVVDAKAYLAFDPQAALV